MQTKIIYISENRNLSVARDELLKAHLIGCDTETTSLDCLIGKIRLLQLATVDKTFVLDCFKLSKSAILEYIIEPIFYNPEQVKILHNAKFDLSFIITNFGADLSRIVSIYDTYIIAKLCLGGSFYQASLGNLAKDYLDVELDKTNQLYNWAGNIYKEQIVYAALDAAVLIPLYHVLNKAVNANCLQKTALLELETIPAIIQLERNGILLDRDMWLDIAEAGREELYKIEKELENYFGRINFKSSAQVSKELSTLTGLNISSVAKGALEGLIDNYEPRPGLFDDRDYRPAVLKLMEHRREQKRYDAFGPAFLNHIHPKTGRIHPSVKQIDTRTGRPSCTNPNMFQIPRDSAMRKCFIAPPGKKIITKDYSQIELRLLAQFSGDAGLRKAFEDGLDLHTATAAEMFNRPLDKVSPDQRQAAKCIAEGSLVTTDFGDIPIEEVTTRYRVWDGVEWVQHDGVIFQGYKEVMTYEGLTATDDHVVFTEQLGPVCFRTAASERIAGCPIKLADTGSDGEVKYYRPNRLRQTRNRLLCTVRSGVHLLLKELLGVRRQRFAWQERSLPLPQKVESTSKAFRGDLQQHSPPVQEQNQPVLQELRRSWDRTSLRFQRTLHQLLYGAFSYGYQGYEAADRQGEQRWPLRTRQHSVRNCTEERTQHASLPPCGVSVEAICGQVRGNRIPELQVSGNQNMERDIVAEGSGGELDRSPATRVQARKQICRVFDILNAGPRHRFTVSGVLVKNCISFGVPYGMGPNKLATTLKIEKSKAQGLLKKYYATYPGLEVWFEQQRQYLMANNCVRTASGRLKDVSDWRVDADKEFKAQQSSKNMPIQGSSADIIKTSISRMYRELPHDCLLINVIYDECVFEVPEECAEEYNEDIERIMLDSAREWMPDVAATVSTSIGDAWSK